jgi:hypothetical protein
MSPGPRAVSRIVAARKAMLARSAVGGNRLDKPRLKVCARHFPRSLSSRILADAITGAPKWHDLGAKSSRSCASLPRIRTFRVSLTESRAQSSQPRAQMGVTRSEGTGSRVLVPGSTTVLSMAACLRHCPCGRTLNLCSRLRTAVAGTMTARCRTAALSRREN